MRITLSIHMIIRGLSALLILYALLGMSSTVFAVYREYSPLHGDIGFYSIMISTIALPLFVLAEFLWVKNRRAFAIDMAFAIAWFFCFWGIVIYTFLTVPIF